MKLINDLSEIQKKFLNYKHNRPNDYFLSVLSHYEDAADFLTKLNYDLPEIIERNSPREREIIVTLLEKAIRLTKLQPYE